MDVLAVFKRPSAARARPLTLRRAWGWTLAQGAGAAPIAGFLLLWELAARVGWVDSFLIPPPSQIVQTIGMLITPGASSGYYLPEHTWRSLVRVFAGFALAVAVGVAVGVGVGTSRRVYAFCMPIVSILQPIPALAWTPILMLILGLDDRTTIAVVFLAAIFPILYSTARGIQGVSRPHRWAYLTMGGKQVGLITQVLIPGGLPHIIVGARIAMAYSWRALVAAEMLAATSWGLGFMIFDAKEYWATDIIYSGIVALAVTGFTIERLAFGGVERWTIERWGLVTRAS